MTDVQLNGAKPSQALCKEQQILTTASKTILHHLAFVSTFLFVRPVADRI